MAVRALYMMDCGGGEFDYGVLVAMGSMNRLIQLAKRENAILFPGHKPGCWNTIKRSPDRYR